MVNKIRAQADKLGLSSHHLTILYAQGRSVHMMFSRSKPDLADVIRDHINLKDPSFVQDLSGGGKNNTHHYLSQKMNLYVELLDRVKGWGPSMMSPTNHLIQISIFTNSYEVVRDIAQALNKVWEDGMLAHIDWNKMEEMYKIHRADYITTWNAVLK